MTTGSDPERESAKRKALSRVAATAGEAESLRKQLAKALAQRNAEALAAHGLGAEYAELGKAAGLTKVGVYKMLSSAAGGSLAKPPAPPE